MEGQIAHVADGRPREGREEERQSEGGGEKLEVNRLWAYSVTTPEGGALTNKHGGNRECEWEWE